MKDGTEYVFDWWPTLNPKNPLISTYPQWLIAGTTIENRVFRGLTRVEPAPARSKLGNVTRSALRVALAVAAIMVVAVIGALAQRARVPARGRAFVEGCRGRAKRTPCGCRGDSNA